MVVLVWAGRGSRPSSTGGLAGKGTGCTVASHFPHFSTAAPTLPPLILVFEQLLAPLPLVLQYA